MSVQAGAHAPSGKTGQRHVYSIDLLRLAAALLVTSYHLGFKAFAFPGYFGLVQSGDPRWMPWSGLTWFGWVGVQIFFVISGYVIAYSAQGTTPSRYAASRAKRLVPGMWVCVGLCAILAVMLGAGPSSLVLPVLRSLTFFPFGPWIAAQIWTLPIEIPFYAAVFVWLVRGWALDSLSLALAVLSAAYWITQLMGVHDPAGRVSALMLLQHGCYFALGLLSFQIGRTGWTPGRLALVACCLLTAWPQMTATLLSEHVGFGLEAHTLVPYLVWLTAVALMGVGLRYQDALARAIGRFSPAIRWGGLVTYPVYLLHYHVGGVVMTLVSGHPALSVVAGTGATVVVSAWVALVAEPGLRTLMFGRGVKCVSTRTT